VSEYVGRYAPSPTGDLHLGNALAAVIAWSRAHRARGKCLLRMEDLDVPRVVDGSAARIVEDLAALGLSFDGDVLVQSNDVSPYQNALERLKATGLVYACRCSRKDLARIASAPHFGDDGPPYPGTCRGLNLPFDDPALPVAWRFRVHPESVVVDDRLQGTFVQDVASVVGDFVLKRKDGLIAYQLAVVVDDARQGISEVVRGADLLFSTPRQVLLFRALGLSLPAFAHLPLWVDAQGNRLSKRTGSTPEMLRTLFASPMSGSHVLGKIGAALGVCDPGEAIDSAALADRLSDDVLSRPTVTLRE